jgi:transposase InsO family protein
LPGIAAEKAEYTIAECCRALRVSASGFYAWQQRPESPHAVRDRQLRVLIRASHEGNRRAYGSPRVLKDLLEQGIPISRKRVVRLMRAEGLKARVRKRFESYAHAKEALFDYIEVFYNQRRRHSTLGQLSPAEFERRFNAA